MQKILAIVGTDTEIGKTYACCAIMRYVTCHIRQNIVALKPISCGISSQHDHTGLNEDVYQLRQASSLSLAVQQINPFAFSAATSPHLAAQLMETQLTAAQIAQTTTEIISSLATDTSILIEGVGGVMVPLNAHETYLDLLQRWQYPVILVVGIKLGCLNHARLSCEVLQQAGVPLLGFIANQLSPEMPYYAENLAYLTSNLSIPLLATTPYQGELQATAKFKEHLLCN